MTLRFIATYLTLVAGFCFYTRYLGVGLWVNSFILLRASQHVLLCTMPLLTCWCFLDFEK